jgi:hypothetical protein
MSLFCEKTNVICNCLDSNYQEYISLNKLHIWQKTWSHGKMYQTNLYSNGYYEGHDKT